MTTAKWLCFVLLVCSSVCFSQQPTASNEAPSREDVMKYLEALHVRQTTEQLLEGMRKQMKDGFEIGFKHRLPNATPEQIVKANSMSDDVFSEIKVDELVEVSIPIFQKHISKADLQQILAFYQSPVGQRLLAEQPAMMQESMQAGADLMKSKLPDLFQKLDARLEKEFPELAKKKDDPLPKQTPAQKQKPTHQ